MCAQDPNAAAREKAKQRHRWRLSKHRGAEIKYWNRETTFTRGLQAAAMGLSRDKSALLSQQLYVIGRARKQQEALEAAYNKERKVSDQTGVGRSTRFGANQYAKLLRSQAAINNHVDNTTGRDTDALFQNIQRSYNQKIEQNKSKLGVPPTFGPPTMMPPKNPTGQFLASLQMGLGIASSLSGMGAFGKKGLFGNLEDGVNG